MIMMKPHHFMDIIKLYGAGIESFVPDEAYEHDFYLKENEILKCIQQKNTVKYCIQ